MKRPQLVSPGTLNRLGATARDSWKQKDFQQSIDTLERASRLDPANFMVLLELGGYYGLRYDYAAAERCFERIFRIAPARTAALSMVAEKCRGFARQDMAEKYFKQALEQNDVPPEACVELAEICERAHKLEEATALVERALRLNPKCGLALLARARLERQAGRLQEAENTIRSLLALPEPGAQPSRQRDQRIRAWYELGAILDRQKRFDEAMATFLDAKSMLRLHSAQCIGELKITRGYARKLRESISSQTLQRWFDAAAQLQPPIGLA